MNILKRPMFYAALVCSVAAALSLYVMPLSFALIVTSIIFLIFITIYYKNYKYITVILAIVLFSLSLIVEFAKINDLKQCDREKITGLFLVTEDVTDHDSFNSVTLKEVSCSAIPNNVNFLVFDYEKNDLKMGDVVNATLKLSIVEKYDEYMISDYSSGIYATASIVKLKKSGEFLARFLWL